MKRAIGLSIILAFIGMPSDLLAFSKGSDDMPRAALDKSSGNITIILPGAEGASNAWILESSSLQGMFKCPEESECKPSTSEHFPCYGKCIRFVTPIGFDPKTSILYFALGLNIAQNVPWALFRADLTKKSAEFLGMDFGSSIQALSVSPDGYLLDYAVTQHGSACHVSFDPKLLDFESRSVFTVPLPLSVGLARVLSSRWVSSTEIEYSLERWSCDEKSLDRTNVSTSTYRYTHQR